MKISSEDKIEFLSKVLTFVFGVQKYLMPTIEVNKPKFDACIYALWHGHQCSLYGLSDREKNHVLISKSVDGQIIANAIETLGMKAVRGSKGKQGAVEATMQMISLLKENKNAAITVDGPRGPRGIVKNGIIKIAKMSGCPIVPYVWYSPDISFITLPTWDNFTYPLGYTRMLNLFGEPVFVDKNGTDEDDEAARLKVENALKELNQKAPEEWKKAWKHRLWIKK
ncbi:lysophospholipid acyltransferase family protein [bacterium]|nr:lysophospholipid acyltransferase family protein [bacterium]